MTVINARPVGCSYSWFWLCINSRARSLIPSFRTGDDLVQRRDGAPGARRVRAHARSPDGRGGVQRRGLPKQGQTDGKKAHNILITSTP